MKTKLSAVFCLLFLWASTALHAQRTLSNPNASPEAKALYKYIQAMSGQQILSGQMWSNYAGDELAYIQTETGKQPAIRGMDFITQSQNNAEVQRAIDWWRSGGIPTIMWHWGAPSKGEGYDASLMTIDINRCFQVGTAEYNAFWSELRLKADLLQRLRDANVPVLWRPFHELNGNWFWWGKGGSTQFKRLWTTMYNYLVNDRGLNNLIWVLCYTGSPDGNWFPGNQYVDIAGADTYTTSTGSQLGMFNATKNATGGNAMPIAYHECGTPPNPDQCRADGAMWSWWMEWHSSHLFNLDKNYLRFLYNHSLVITKDEVPNIMAVYGGGGSSNPVAAGTYSLRNRASGKMLDNLGATANGANVGQWADGSSNNQRYVLSYAGGYARLMCVTGSKYLDSMAHTADGSTVSQWDSSTSQNQQWTLQSVGNGYYKIVNRANGKCLDTGGATNDGGIMKFWASGSSFNQQWQFVTP